MLVLAFSRYLISKLGFHLKQDMTSIEKFFFLYDVINLIFTNEVWFYVVVIEINDYISYLHWPFIESEVKKWNYNFFPQFLLVEGIKEYNLHIGCKQTSN